MSWRVPVAAALLATWTLLPAVGGGAQGSPAQTKLEQERKACRAEKADLGTMMTSVFRDFDAAQDPVSVELLVAVDRRIRALLRSRPTYRPCEPDGELIYDKRWERMGVTTGFFNDLTYTGRLLVVAHQKFPRSPLRAHTLFSTVFGESPAHGLGVMPDLQAAYTYEAEFPDGPFIMDVYRTIADFHKDLFMVLRDRLTDFKYKCFAAYITAGSRSTQEERAKSVAVDYYQRLLQLAPGDELVRTLQEQTRTGVVQGWSFCAD